MSHAQYTDTYVRNQDKKCPTADKISTSHKIEGEQNGTISKPEWAN